MDDAGCTILLVEDEQVDVMMIQRAFKKAQIGNPLQVVGDGDAAVAYLAGQPPYADREASPFPILMLLDLKLPRRSGLEVLAWLRQQPEIRKLPVIVLTSSRESADVQRAYDLGANAYLVKPVEHQALCDMMHSLKGFWLVLSELPGASDC